MVALIRAVLTGLLAISVGACGGTAAPASGPAVSSGLPSAAPETPSGAPTTEASPAAAADYPYTLAWPEDELQTSWRYATVAWDGTARIDHGNKYTDQVTTKDGDLFAFGYPTTISVAQLESKFASQATEWHGCDAEPMEREPLPAEGSDGMFAVYRCGSTPVLRWVGINDGFGLFVGLILKPLIDTEDATARFKERIGGLRWGPRAASARRGAGVPARERPLRTKIRRGRWVSGTDDATSWASSTSSSIPDARWTCPSSWSWRSRPSRSDGRSWRPSSRRASSPACHSTSQQLHRQSGL